MHILNKDLKIHSPNAIKILEYIKEYGGQGRFIGGIVRNTLAGQPHSDIDIATDILPHHLSNLLSSNGIHVIPTGIQFGTITAIINHEPFELTTLRKDIECYGRKAKVEFSTDFAEDAKRRDFTINALSYCPFEHKIFDYFSGISDLKEGKVKFIGNSEERIREDYLRILRFFRFSAQFTPMVNSDEFERFNARELEPIDKRRAASNDMRQLKSIDHNIDQEGLKSCINLKQGLKTLSKERIHLEMKKIFLLGQWYNILSIMYKNDILQQCLPIYQYHSQMIQEAVQFGNSLNHQLSTSIKYALLFIDSNHIDIQKLTHLKFSKQEIRIILSLLSLKNFHNEEDLLFHLTKIWLKEEKYLDYFIFAMVIKPNSCSVINILLTKLLKIKNKPFLPVNGTDLQAMGFKDKQIGIKLKQLKALWINSHFHLSKQELISILSQK